MWLRLKIFYFFYKIEFHLKQVNMKKESKNSLMNRVSQYINARVTNVSAIYDKKFEGSGN